MPTDSLAVRSQIAQATTEPEVLTLVSAYLDEWADAEMTALPAPCRPPVMGGADELLLHAVLLASHRYDDVPRWVEHDLDELCDVFREAAIRITMLRAARRKAVF